MNDHYMNIALKEAKKAFKKKEIPVGCVIVKNNKIISQAHNKKEKTKCLTNHAELIAIQKANRKLKNWRLDDCVLYTTMEPCMMCCGAIKQSRIKKVVYGINNENYGFTEHLNDIEIIPYVKKNECLDLIKQFFKTVR